MHGYPNVRTVSSFEELVSTRFAGEVNALCWERSLEGDFAEISRLVGEGEGLETLDEDRLLALPVSSPAAVNRLVADLQLLRDHGLDPVLNCIHGYPKDDSDDLIHTDVYSFHADRAPVEADTFLCTYFGPASELLRNDEVRRKVDLPELRSALLKQYGGPDDEDFRDYLREHCYDLHYAPLPGVTPLRFQTGHLWRLAIAHPGCPVPPCIHRAPTTRPGEKRLLLIS